MGTSFDNKRAWNNYTDHPHAYGDKSHASWRIFSGEGSSPRVWGQDLTKAYIARCKRIIPTRMGTSAAGVFQSTRHADHPHAYGDKLIISADALYRLGSSPRVWGQDQFDNIDIDNNRIIPTRMGTRGRGYGIFVLAWDHPHAYGDKAVYSPKALSMSGSSPRVWGQVIRYEQR